MSKATGVPLSTYRWNETGSNHHRATLTFFQKQKIVRQLGQIYAYMSNIRFDQIGSLFRKDGSYVTGKCLYPSLFWQSRDEFDEEDIPRGPFTEAESFYKALISALFVHVKELSMEHHLFHGPVPLPEEHDDFQEYRIATDRWNDYVAVGSKTDSMQSRLDYALVGLSLQDSVPYWLKNTTTSNAGGFHYPSQISACIVNKWTGVFRSPGIRQELSICK